MAVNLVKYEMEVPKEGKEVVDFVAGLLEDIKAKKSIAELSAENLPALMSAIDGYEHLGEEAKSDHRDELSGYLVHKLMSALIPVEAEEPAPEA